MRLGLKHLFMLFGLFSTTMAWSSDVEIKVAEDDLTLVYGNYAEVELSLGSITTSGEIEWDVLDQWLPAGLNFSSVTGHSVKLQGIVSFLDQWCTVIGAYAYDKLIASKRLCFYGLASSSFPHLRFATERYLDDGAVNRPLRQSVAMASGEVVLQEMSVIDEEMPLGLSGQFNQSTKTLDIAGIPALDGVVNFAVEAVDSEGYYVYKQFEIYIAPAPSVNTPAGGAVIFDCPDGYYYDASFGYCVQAAGPLCQGATYFDTFTGTCRQYPQPPPQVFCGLGTYFDPYLEICVSISAPRCPRGYNFDGYRCVRNRYECPRGHSYSFAQGACIPLYRTTCGINEYWDVGRSRCVPVVRYCPNGYWNHRTNSCVNVVRNSCGRNERWNPLLNRCESVAQRCPPSYRFDGRSGRCEPTASTPRACPPGSSWSRSENRCVHFNNDRPQRPWRPEPPRRPDIGRPNTPPTRPPSRPEVGRPNTPPNTPPSRPEVGRPNTPPGRPELGRPNTPPGRPEVGRPNTPPNTPPSRPEVGRPNTPPSRPEVGRPNTPPSRPEVGRPNSPPSRPEVGRPNTPPGRPEVGRPNTPPNTPPSRPEVGRPNSPPSRPEVGRPNTPPSRPEVGRPNSPPSRPEVGRPNTPPSRPEVGRPNTPPSRPEVGRPNTPPSRPEVSRPSTPPSRPERPSTPPGRGERPSRGESGNSGDRPGGGRR